VGGREQHYAPLTSESTSCGMTWTTGTGEHTVSHARPVLQSVNFKHQHKDAPRWDSNDPYNNCCGYNILALSHVSLHVQT